MVKTNHKEKSLSISSFLELNNNHVYLVTGLLLVMLYITQLVLNLRWEWLDELQSGELYRQLTGFILLAYVLMQGNLGYQRMRHPKVSHSSLFDYHKIQGVYGPALFYIHSVDIGFAYQIVLTVVFLGNCIVGYLSPQAIHIRNKFYIQSWTALHIGLAIITLVLMLFHIYIVYYYS